MRTPGNREDTHMKDKRRDQIIDDLLLKRPTANGCTYEDERYYDFDRGEYRTRAVSSHKTFGYGDEVLFQLGLHSYRSVETYVRQMFYGGKIEAQLTRGQRGGVTRKANRIWDRIGSAVSRIQTHGTESSALYEVKAGRWGDIVGHVYADDVESARVLASVTFGYLVSGPADIYVRVAQITDDVSVLNDWNEKATEVIREEIKRNEKLISKKIKRCELLRARLNALSIIRSHAEPSEEAAVAK